MKYLIKKAVLKPFTTIFATRVLHMLRERNSWAVERTPRYRSSALSEGCLYTITTIYILHHLKLLLCSH